MPRSHKKTRFNVIHKRGFSNLHVTAASPFSEQALAMGNRKDWPELTSIINKALASITEEEKTAIRNKYLAIKYEQGIDSAELLKWVLIIGGVASGFVFIFLFWNRRLSLEIRTRRQTEQELNMEAILEVIEGISEHAPDAAECLRLMVQSFQIERIRELLGKVA